MQHQDFQRSAKDNLLTIGRIGGLGQDRNKVQEAGGGLPRRQVQEPELQPEEVQHQQAGVVGGENFPRFRGEAPGGHAGRSGDPHPGGLLLPRSQLIVLIAVQLIGSLEVDKILNFELMSLFFLLSCIL